MKEIMNQGLMEKFVDDLVSAAQLQDNSQDNVSSHEISNDVI